MKYIYCIFLLFMTCCPLAMHAGNEPTYLPDIAVTAGDITKEGRTVRLTLDIDLSETRIRTQHTVALIPVIVSADGNRKASFPPIVIDGKTRNNVYLRARQLESVELPPYHDDNAQVVIRRINGKPQNYAYSASISYKRWMLDGRVELREEIHGCVNCDEGLSEATLWGEVLPAYMPDYRFERIYPAPEPVKARAETRTARLQFRQDSYNIRPDYKGNRAELDTISHSIELVKSNPYVTITGIYITGYASPEGSEAHNLTLSENRARALARYIGQHDHISPQILHVEWKGEDWDGFVRALDDFPGLLGRDRVLEIIDMYPDVRDFCELQLRRLKPSEIYHRLLNEVYPILRRNEYRIEYNVRNFDLDEARRIINERPELLSLAEMYKVAGSYDIDSPEYAHAMATAARYFPMEPAVLNDTAMAAIDSGEYATAVKTLARAASTADNPALLNTLGIAYAMTGDYYKAEEAFRTAAQGGCSAAEHNLSEILQVIDQL